MSNQDRNHSTEEENLFTGYQVAIYLVILAQHKTLAPLLRPQQAELARTFLQQSSEGLKLLKRAESRVFRKLFRTAIEFFIPGFGAHLLTRKVFIETKVQEFISEHPDAQVVSIGCGLDTLLTRLADQGVKNNLIEIDYPIVAQRKAKVRQQENLEFIGADLSQVSLETALEKSKYDIRKPVFFIAEGVLMYVSKEPAYELLNQLPTLNNSSMKMIFSAMAPRENEHAVSNTLKKLLNRKNTNFHWTRTPSDLQSDLDEMGLDTLEQLSHQAMHDAGFGNHKQPPKHYFVGEYYNLVEKR